MDYAKESLRLHEQWRGKIEVVATVPVATKSPGTGRGGGAHREPVVKVGSAPGARPGRGAATY